MMENTMIRLDNWSVCFAPRDRYTPPEMSQKSLQGNAFGHPKHDDGKHIATSLPVKVDGRIVTTCSGSVYKLGRIDPKYRQWLKENFPNWNWRKPLSLGEYDG